VKLGVKFEGTINIENLLDRFINFLFGTISSRLITIGVSFLTFGMWDVLVFAFEAKILDRNVDAPGSSFGWSEGLGIALLLLGLFISFIKYWRSKSDKFSDRRVKLLEEFHDISNTRLQEEALKVFNIRSPDVYALRLVLSHPTNQMGAILLFQYCHLNVERHENWFSLKGRFFKARYNLGFILWIFFPILAIFSLLLAVMERSSPGVTSSGQNAWIAYSLICLLVIASATLMFGELKKMGTAVTLVEKYEPVMDSQPKLDINKKIQRERDIQALKWILSSIHLPTVDQHMLDSPHMIIDKVFFFWEGFNGVYSNRLFSLYDQEVSNLIDKLHLAWSTTLSFHQCYHSNHNGSIHIFSNPGDAPLSHEQEECWDAIVQACKIMNEALHELLSIVRYRYLEIDIMESSSKAWHEYIENERL
jgi:hypothetical protein